MEAKEVYLVFHRSRDEYLHRQRIAETHRLLRTKSPPVLPRFEPRSSLPTRPCTASTATRPLKVPLRAPPLRSAGTPNLIPRPVAALQPTTSTPLRPERHGASCAACLATVDLHHVGSTSLPPLLSGRQTPPPRAHRAQANPLPGAGGKTRGAANPAVARQGYCWRPTPA